LIVQDLLFKQQSIPKSQFFVIKKGQLKEVINQSIVKTDLIGKLSDPGFHKVYFKDIEQEFSNAEQMNFSQQVLLDYLTKNYRKHEKINVVGIIEPSFFQYGCLTF
jgi:hypothetical protein